MIMDNIGQQPSRSAAAGTSDYNIHLNFLPVIGEFGLARVYRKEISVPQEERPGEGVMASKLPRAAGNSDDWASYWVSLDPREGFEGFDVVGSITQSLATRLLFRSMIDSAAKMLPPERYRIPTNEFIQEIDFVCRQHSEGDEQLVVQPLYLRAVRQYGYLLDFHFKLAEGVAFSRRVQQLSLSLNANFGRNLDYYRDRSSKVQTFRRELKDVLENLRLPQTGVPIHLGADFVSLPAERLRSKVYVFGGNKESRSQFNGLREYGPLKPLSGPPKLLFMFREQDRNAARTLALSLRGPKLRQPFGFPGFQALFKSELEIDGNPAVLPDLTQNSILKALERAKGDRQANSRVLPVLVLPDNEDNGYMEHKALFTHAEIPTQVCTLRILQDQDSLKWAIGNLALQLFCKAGGEPWKVRIAHERSLIVGISQSHKKQYVNGTACIEKYFAFSVMTDSSGLFQKIQVLGESNDERDYLEKLRENLNQILIANKDQFARIVVHTSFKLKHREIDAIHQTVKDAAASAGGNHAGRFAVVKVNQHSRFFGINRGVNSFVPYEASKVWLGPGEYLVWFEGIFPDKPTVNKAFPGPTHLQFLRVSDEGAVPDHVLLQDLVNLSGANWRGFNAKSAPVSVFYCHLVAERVRDFQERGLPLPAVSDIRPWFL